MKVQKDGPLIERFQTNLKGFVIDVSLYRKDTPSQKFVNKNDGSGKRSNESKNSSSNSKDHDREENFFYLDKIQNERKKEKSMNLGMNENKSPKILSQ